MLHISLFSGIGGFDLAAEWMGWTNIVSCEINDFGNKVLKHYWPNAYHHRDVKTLTLETINEQLGRNWRTDDVILTGGFPCQPYSSAGKRKGKEDERHLWPEMLRVIREIKPSYIVGENVSGLLSWSGGLVFDEVHSDLEAEGYEVQAVVIPAAAVNAPHGRDRVWFVAKNTNENGWRSFEWENQSNQRKQWNTGSRNNERLQTDDVKIRTFAHAMCVRCGRWNKQSKTNQSKKWEANKDKQQNRDRIWCEIEGCDLFTSHPNSNELHTSDSGHEEQPSERGEYAQRNVDEIHNKESVIEHTNSVGQECRMHNDKQKNAIQLKFSERDARSFRMPTWDNFPTIPPVCFRNDGLSHQLDGITFSKWRKESIKAAGNAVVPQVVYEIFKAIESTRK